MKLGSDAASYLFGSSYYFIFLLIPPRTQALLQKKIEKYAVLRTYTEDTASPPRVENFYLTRHRATGYIDGVGGNQRNIIARG